MLAITEMCVIDMFVMMMGSLLTDDLGQGTSHIPHRNQGPPTFPRFLEGCSRHAGGGS